MYADKNIVFDASNEVLLKHKENVDVLNVDNLSADEVGKKVKEWADFCIEHY